MAMKSQTQRSLLMGFVGSIACCGLVGIYCLTLGQWGPFEARVLGTTAAVGAASILALASAIPWERRRWHPIGLLGLVAVPVALILVLVAIWMEGSLGWPNMEYLLKAMGVACVLAVALPHVGLLSLAHLRRQYGWVRGVSVMVIAMLGGQIILTIFVDPHGDGWLRFMGALGILVTCGTIAVPILHRVSIIRTREAIRTVELAITLTCPRCETSQHLCVGRSACAACGLVILIEIEEEQCPTCGYALYKLESAVCPECGTPIMKPKQAEVHGASSTASDGQSPGADQGKG